MIEVSRLDGSRFYVNAIHIETVEATPDTVITLFSGKKLLVRERPEGVVRAVLDYQQRIAERGPMPLPSADAPGEPGG